MTTGERLPATNEEYDKQERLAEEYRSLLEKAYAAEFAVVGHPLTFLRQLAETGIFVPKEVDRKAPKGQSGVDFLSYFPRRQMGKDALREFIAKTEEAGAQIEPWQRRKIQYEALDKITDELRAGRVYKPKQQILYSEKINKLKGEEQGERARVREKKEAFVIETQPLFKEEGVLHSLLMRAFAAGQEPEESEALQKAIARLREIAIKLKWRSETHGITPWEERDQRETTILSAANGVRAQQEERAEKKRREAAAKEWRDSSPQAPAA